jgi:pyruvate formate-lyase activating enzyme-like uncharacterized protein
VSDLPGVPGWKQLVTPGEDPTHKPRRQNRASGPLSRGCCSCLKGGMLVLSVTHLCDRGCFYCSNPTGRRDVTVANDCLVRSDRDILREAAWSRSASACITGGEPLLRLERTCRYIRMLKATFGREFHTHLYTSRVEASTDELRELRDAGLDEIRFHLHSADETLGLQRALQFSWTVGIEVPAIPEGETSGIVEAGIELQVAFVNLNEFCFFPGFAETATQRGWALLPPIVTKIPRWDDSNPATVAAVYGQPLLRIRGSRELGEQLVAGARGSRTTVHFCGAGSKYYIQLPRRLARRAARVRWAPEETTKKGTLLSSRLRSRSPERREQIAEALAGEGLAGRDELLIPRDEDYVIAPWAAAAALAVGKRPRNARFQDVSAELFERYPLPPGAEPAPHTSVYVFRPSNDEAEQAASP